MLAVQEQRRDAVRTLEQAYNAGLGFGLWLHRDLDLASLRGYPALEEFVRLRE
jgi:hypothetical protein